MKISFNGNVFSANGQCIIGGGTGNTQKFDEVKAKDCSISKRYQSILHFTMLMFPFPILQRLKHISMVRQILMEMSTLMFM